VALATQQWAASVPTVFFQASVAGLYLSLPQAIALAASAPKHLVASFSQQVAAAQLAASVAHNVAVLLAFLF